MKKTFLAIFLFAAIIATTLAQTPLGGFAPVKFSSRPVAIPLTNGAYFNGLEIGVDGVLYGYEGDYTTADSTCYFGMRMDSSFVPFNQEVKSRRADGSEWTVTFRGGHPVDTAEFRQPEPPVRITTAIPVECQSCSATGKCTECRGTGLSPDHAPGLIPKCNVCRGTGKCLACNGEGHTTH